MGWNYEQKMKGLMGDPITSNLSGCGHKNIKCDGHLYIKVIKLYYMKLLCPTF